jgi:hypothetical protein
MQLLRKCKQRVHQTTACIEDSEEEKRFQKLIPNLPLCILGALGDKFFSSTRKIIFRVPFPRA